LYDDEMVNGCGRLEEKEKKNIKRVGENTTNTRGIERGILVFDRFLLEL